MQTWLVEAATSSFLYRYPAVVPTLLAAAAALYGCALVATLTGGTFLQVAFNVLFFVPLGFLVAYAARRGIGFALVVGLLGSLLIEATQGTGLWSLYPCPYRLADVDDLLTNTLGAAWRPVSSTSASSRSWPER